MDLIHKQVEGLKLPRGKKASYDIQIAKVQERVNKLSEQLKSARAELADLQAKKNAEALTKVADAMAVTGMTPEQVLELIMNQQKLIDAKDEVEG